MRAVIYARLSREDEDKIDGNKESRSVENQITLLTEIALEKKFDIVNVYYDDGYTGSNLDRPGFMKMMSDAENKKFDVLLVKDLSRLGRKMYQVANLVEKILPTLNIRLIAVNDNYDSLTYKDDESIVLRTFLNDYYLKDFKRKCKKSLEHRANTIHLNYYPKYGYIYDKDGNEIIDLVAAEVIKKIFELVPTLGYAKTANYLNEQNILTRSQYQTQVLKLKPLHKAPATSWDSGKVLEIASDYEYCGHIVNLLKSKNGPIIIKDKRPRIISEEQYELANKARLERKARLESRVNKLDFIYGDEHRRFAYSSKEDTYIYKFNNITIQEDTLIKILYEDAIEVLQNIKTDSDEFLEILKNRIRPPKGESKSEVEKKLKKLDLEYASLLEMLFTNQISAKYFETQSYKLNVKIKELKDKLSNLETVNTNLALLERRYLALIEKLKMEPQNELELIRIMIEKVVIKKLDNKELDVKIKYKFEI